MATVKPYSDFEDEDVASQIATAQALRNKGLNAPAGQMVGDWYVPTNPLGTFAQTFGGGIMERMGRERQGEIQTARQKQDEAYLAHWPEDTVERTRELAGPPTEEGVGPGTITERVAKDPRQFEQDMYRYAMSAPNTALGQQMRLYALQRAMTSPERHALAAEKVTAATAAAEERKLLLLALALGKKEEAERYRTWQAAQNQLNRNARAGRAGVTTEDDENLGKTQFKGFTPEGEQVVFSPTKSKNYVIGADGTTKPYTGSIVPQAQIGNPLPVHLEKESRELANNLSALKTLESSFKDEYAGGPHKVAQRIVGATLGGVAPEDTEEMTRWWADQSYMDELPVRHKYFGSALTPVEKKSWQDATVTPNTSAATIRNRLAIRKKIYNDAMTRIGASVKAGGYNMGQFNAITGRGAESGPDTGGAPAAPVKAPQAALDYLRDNPGTAPQFKAKYGYLP